MKDQLPENAPILTWVYILGQAYPYGYTQEQREILKQVRYFRKRSQELYITGAGYFTGMKCGAGSGFIVMDWGGCIRRCYVGEGMGNFISLGVKDFNFCDKPEICTAEYCNTPFWGLWFGDPEFISKKLKVEKSEMYFCRYGPK